jgi:carbonic anhydrase
MILYSSVRLAYSVPPVLELFNNSHAIEAHWKSEDATSAAFLTGGPLGGAVFRLEQLHFHAPSEHLIDGSR